MIDAKVEAILIKVATLGLNDKHLGLSPSQVRDHLHKMVIIMLIIIGQRYLDVLEGIMKIRSS